MRLRSLSLTFVLAVLALVFVAGCSGGGGSTAAHSSYHHHNNAYPGDGQYQL